MPAGTSTSNYIWTPADKETLLKSIQTHGRDYQKIADVFHGSKTKKQVKSKIQHLRYEYKKNPSRTESEIIERMSGVVAKEVVKVKAPIVSWSTEESQSLLEAIKTHGRDYEKIAPVFNGSKSKLQIMKKINNLR